MVKYGKGVIILTEYVRKIDKLGRIVVPMEYRKRCGLDIDDEASITEENGRIIIKRKIPACKLCGATEKLNSEVSLCEECIKRVKNL